MAFSAGLGKSFQLHASRVSEPEQAVGLTKVASAVADVVGFGADLITLILGVIGLVALIRNKKKIALAFKALLATFVNERVKRVRETLSKIEGLSFEEKNDRPEIFALFGQIAGQSKPLASGNDTLKNLHEEAVTIFMKKMKLTEPLKRRFVSEFQAALDDLAMTETQKWINEAPNENP